MKMFEKKQSTNSEIYWKYLNKFSQRANFRKKKFSIINGLKLFTIFADELVQNVIIDKIISIGDSRLNILALKRNLRVKANIPW
jgi:hypothetical protein